MTEQKIGYIGVGNMGGPMCSRLLDRGLDLTVCDASAEAVVEFAQRGAVVAKTPKDLASSVDIVLVCLPTPAIVREVVLGPDGVAAGNRAKTFVDLSTTGPEVEREIAAALAEKGIAAADAPVSGGVGGAKAGTLAVMLACPDALAAELRPILETFGNVFHVGTSPGLGQTMKLCNNMLAATAVAATAEAMAAGVKAGLDAQTMLDVINSGSGRNTSTDGLFPRAVLPRGFNLGFSAGLMRKDVNLFLAAAATLGVPTDVTAAVGAIWDKTVADLGASEDFTKYVRRIEGLAGVEIAGRKNA